MITSSSESRRPRQIHRQVAIAVAAEAAIAVTTASGPPPEPQLPPPPQLPEPKVAVIAATTAAGTKGAAAFAAAETKGVALPAITAAASITAATTASVRHKSGSLLCGVGGRHGAAAGRHGGPAGCHSPRPGPPPATKAIVARLAALSTTAACRAGESAPAPGQDQY